LINDPLTERKRSSERRNVVSAQCNRASKRCSVHLGQCVVPLGQRSVPSAWRSVPLGQRFVHLERCIVHLGQRSLALDRCNVDQDQRNVALKTRNVTSKRRKRDGSQLARAHGGRNRREGRPDFRGIRLVCRAPHTRKNVGWVSRRITPVERGLHHPHDLGDDIGRHLVAGE